ALYDIMFLYTGNLNVPENMRTLTNHTFVEQARQELDKRNLKHHDYMSTGDYLGDTHFNLGSIHARSSATNYALTNTVSTLIEVRGVNLGRTSFKRRMATTYTIGLSYLKTAYANAAQVKQEIGQAQEAFKEVTVTSTRKVYQDTIQMIDLDTYELLDMPITVRDALQSTPKLVRPKPAAYILLPEQTDLIEKLHILGIETQVLEQPQTFTVEAYQVTGYDRDEQPYEKMERQTVETQLQTKTITFPQGTYMVSTQQKNAPLLSEVLEPEAPNSFISFGVLKTELDTELPIYRLSK